jgi:SPP1 gp7 family putative phage head morphogenesis protein
MTASGGIQAVMTTPLHMDRVGVVYSRAYSELKGITSAMDKQISQVLAKGIIDGENPKALARALVKTISGIGGDLSMTDSLGRFIPARRRAAMLARTEIIRAHHQGQVQEMRNWAVAGVTVKAEWVTAGYNVCPKCAENNGKQYTLDEIEPLIPFHPNCRCAIIPIDQTGKDEKKKDSPALVSTPAPKEAGADKARIRFQKEEHNIQFQKEKEKAKEFFDGLGVEKLNTLSKKKSPLRDVLKTYFEKEIPHIWHAMEEWQGSTTDRWPMSLKYVATQMEDGCGEMIWKSGLDATDLYTENISEQYVKFRAIGQAYLETMGIDELLLYRGTDGETGESIVRALTAEGLHRTKWTIEDAPIAGYTTAIDIADDFGRDKHGISVKMLVPKEEIMWHADLLTGVSNRYWEEFEYLILSGKRQFSIDDILLPESSSDTISQATKAPITK